MADIVRPLDQLVPPEFAELAGNPKLGSQLAGKAAAAAHTYGSIMKFSPKGGAIEYRMPDAKRENPHNGEMKLPSALKAVDAAACPGDALRPARVTGAEWMHFGISHVELTQCNCESVRFDVDWFGRVWYPDMGRYRVGVLDSSGNVITHFGGYGNTESGGPKSGSTSSPPDALSLSKGKHPDPDIAFTYLTGVGATDRYAYMGDSINQRLLRARIVYSAEETCPAGP